MVADFKVTKELVSKVIETVDAGLCNGKGVPIPGQMCVEAAVCYAMGLPHGDEPTCVSPAIRSLKIALNDALWSNNEIRAKGMRKLAALQLGTMGVFDDAEFVSQVVRLTISKNVAKALRSAASIHPEEKHKKSLEEAAIRCEQTPDLDAANAASYAASNASYAASNAASNAAANASYAAANASYAASNAASNAAANASYAASYAANAASYADEDAGAARDRELAMFAEDVAAILIDMNVPAVEFLDLL